MNKFSARMPRLKPALMRYPNVFKSQYPCNICPPKETENERGGRNNTLIFYEAQKRQPPNRTKTQLVYARLTHCYKHKSFNLAQKHLYLRTKPDKITSVANAHCRFRCGTAHHLITILALHQAHKRTLPINLNTQTFTQ